MFKTTYKGSVPKNPIESVSMLTHPSAPPPSSVSLRLSFFGPFLY